MRAAAPRERAGGEGEAEHGERERGREPHARLRLRLDLAREARGVDHVALVRAAGDRSTPSCAETRKTSLRPRPLEARAHLDVSPGGVAAVCERFTWRAERLLGAASRGAA
jgi:hypothetical protein